MLYLSKQGGVFVNLKKHLESKKAREEYQRYEEALSRSNALKTQLLFRQYIYSFLAWMHKQNPEYNKYLEPEEVTNFFLTRIEHPKWFLELSEKMLDRFKYIYLLNDSIGKYFGEDIFDYTFVIEPRDKAVSYFVLKRENEEEIGEFVKLKLADLAQEAEIKIPKEELNKMALKDAEASLFVFNKIKKMHVR